MSFDRPLFLWIAFVCAIFFGVALVLDSRRQKTIILELGHSKTLEKMMRSVSSHRRAIKALMFALGSLFVLLALGTPTTKETVSQWKRRGIDIVFAFDFSKSMLAQDIYPSRSRASMHYAMALMDDLSANRIGSVVFAGEVDFFPLTHDRLAAELFYSELRPGDLAPGSDIASALGVARCLMWEQSEDSSCEMWIGDGKGGDPLDDDKTFLKETVLKTIKSSDRAKAIVLFSDGGAGSEHVAKEIEAAREQGIEIFWVGVGSDAGELIPKISESGEIEAWLKDDANEFVRTRLNRQALTQWATLSGDTSHFIELAQGQDNSNDLLSQLRRLKAGELGDRVVSKRRHIYWVFLVLAFIALWVEATMNERKTRRMFVDR